MANSDNKLFLGVDTSNYTTSLALVKCDGCGNILSYKSERRILPVEAGMRGLRQSDAHFNHTKNLPELSEKLFEGEREGDIFAVACSDKPRNAIGSYMPCFLAGISAASLTASALGVPLYKFSHQCMHIAAALYSIGREDLFLKEHLAFHVSGGTTELLKVSPDKEGGFSCDIVGKTLDISAGQLIDRVGVMLGLAFPCGAELERIATETKKRPNICVKGTDINFSGAENKCAEMLKKGISKEEIAAYTLDFVKLSLLKAVQNALEIYPGLPVIFAGGVSGNKRIKECIIESIDAEFAALGLSSDNAVGTAILASRKYFGR